MRNIMLFCNGGFSSSILADKINKESKSKNLGLEASASDILNIDSQVKSDEDVIVLGPQVSHRYEDIKKQYPKNVVVQLTMQEFGMMKYDSIFAAIGL